MEDDVIFTEIEKVIEQKKKRYERALLEEEEAGRTLTRVTDLENSLIDAYIKYLRMKYWVKEHKVVASKDALREIDEFFELVEQDDTD